MNQSVTRRILLVYLLLLVPIAWLASRFDPYQIDGDAVAYMDIADLLHAHHWAGAVNGYWHPLYPACLALAQMVMHPTRMNELGAYYTLNYALFLAQVVAMLFFVTALYRLRGKMNGTNEEPLLSLNALRLLGVGLLVIASQRELSMGKVRTDTLLATLMLAAFTSLLETLASDRLFFAALMGLFFGLAYLTKSFALLVTLLSIGVMMLFQLWIQRRPLRRVMAGGALALVVFAAVAGPYIAALSRQKHRLDFGDSGALAYAWLSTGTEKMHLEPWQTDRFGSASVHLIHPEIQLLAEPGIYSYRAEPYGTYPDWFDPTYFNERIVPHFNLRDQVQRAARNMVLVLRYLLNHPEAWILLSLLLVMGAKFGFTRWRHEAFWAPMILLGLAMWGLYGAVLIEERYVTLAYLVIVLPVFAALRVPTDETAAGDGVAPWMRQTATAMIVLLAFLALGESLRTAAEHRRNQSVEGLPHAWYSKQIFGAAKGLQEIGVKPGDEIACMGTTACVYDGYWARLAGARVLTEVYNPLAKNLLAELEGLPNRQQVYNIVKAQGAKVLVAYFDAGAMTGKTPASSGWVRLGETDFYALPLNLPQPAPAEMPAPLRWPTGSGTP
jgi:hypothetical protein